MLRRHFFLPMLVAGVMLLPRISVVLAGKPAKQPLVKTTVLESTLGIRRGIVVVLGLSPAEGIDADHLLRIAQQGPYTLFFQSADAEEVAAVQQAAEQAGLLGRRIFADTGSLQSIQMADNIADGILVFGRAAQQCPEAELLRVLHPRAVAVVAGANRRLVKEVPAGIDEWTHPYHRPDNNPQSQDQLARGALRTQFIGYPKFSPMPEQTVVAGGRLFKAMGHIAHKANQNPMLNTLLCINAYNGTVLWKRALPPGFMIHRNTMIATEDALYMGDDRSCKIIDARTGKVRGEITVPKNITDGPVWKWMGLQGETLIALVGHTEVKVDTQKSARRGIGHWPWGMWKGHDYSDPRTSFGFGRTLVAIDLKTKNLRWHHREKEFLDGRAICMKNGRLYFYSPQKFLACLDTQTGKVLWKNKDKDLLEAIGPNGRAQHYVTGYATTSYMKCNEELIFFAGPQRSKLVAASTRDGKLRWTYPVGNLQLVLRPDALYAAGPQRTQGVCLDYETGKVKATFLARRACTRATGNLDSIFFRASGGTVRLLTEKNAAQHIAPMRPPCQDGVIISNGYFYWGPWMCGCQLSLYGNIGLRGIGDVSLPDPQTIYADALTIHSKDPRIEPLPIRPGDWPAYRGSNSRNDVATVPIPEKVSLQWTARVSTGDLPTAPVTAGGLVFVANRDGVIQAFDEEGQLRWKAFTAGPIYYPPAIAHDRLYVGSADGRVYAYEAKTGRLLWTFRVSPQERRIPVYGKLISRWPVAAGVVVEGETVYAAAGIAHYDGTYLVALDARSGKLKAQNNTSGSLSGQANSGISIQGVLKVVDGELRFLGGGVYETARYDLKTLRCLNEPQAQVASRYRTAFYPYYPGYGKYVSLEYRCGDGCLLTHAASYEGNYFANLALQRPLPPGARPLRKDAANDYLRILRRRGKTPPRNIWQDRTDRRFTGFIVSGNRLVATGHVGTDERTAFLAAINVRDGKDIWRHPLPALAVKGGAAIDHKGRIFVSLENGRLLCFAPAAAEDK